MRYPLQTSSSQYTALVQMHQLFSEIEERRKLPMTIARAMGALSASYQVALPVLPRTVTRDTRLLPGLQIWVLAPGFAATFWTGFIFQKIFRERLFSGIADYRRDAYQHVPKSHQDVDHATCRSSLRRCRRPAAAASFSSSISARRNRFLWADS